MTYLSLLFIMLECPLWVSNTSSLTELSWSSGMDLHMSTAKLNLSIMCFSGKMFRSSRSLAMSAMSCLNFWFRQEKSSDVLWAKENMLKGWFGASDACSFPDMFHWSSSCSSSDGWPFISSSEDLSQDLFFFLFWLL